MQNAQLRRQTVPQQAQQAPRPQAEATTRPQQWLKASPRPQQWLLIGVPGCRLTGLKRSKPSKRPPSSAHPRMQNAQLRRQKVPQQAQQAPRRSKRSKPSKSPPSSAGKRYPNKPNTRHSRLKRSKRSKPSTSPPSSAGKRYPNKPNTRYSRMQNAQLRRQTVPQQAQQAPRPQAKATARPQQWLKASPRPQQWLLIGVQGCRLTGFKPLKRLKCLAGRLPA